MHQNLYSSYCAPAAQQGFGGFEYRGAVYGNDKNRAPVPHDWYTQSQVRSFASRVTQCCISVSSCLRTLEGLQVACKQPFTLTEPRITDTEGTLLSTGLRLQALRPVLT